MTHQSNRCTRGDLRMLIARCLTDRPQHAAREIEDRGLWEYLAAHAWQNGIGGVLIDQLGRHGIEPPRSAARQLNAYREHVRAANAYKLERVTPLLRMLQSEGIRLLLLKGVALNAVLYEDLGLRPMVDVDVLIRPEDAARVDRLLAENGCTPGSELLRDDYYPRFHYEREYFTAHNPPVKIDLHVRPFRPLRFARTLPDGAFWRDADVVNMEGLRAECPNADTMLIHLAGHAAFHGLRELRWLYDIKRWLDRFSAEIHWEHVAELCDRWSLSTPVRRALGAVRETFSQDQAENEEAVSEVGRFERLLEKLVLWQAPYGDQRHATDVAVNFLSTPGMRFRCGYLKSVLLPGQAHMRQIYRRDHPGWLIVAHALRAMNTLSRLSRTLRTNASEAA